MKDFNGVQRIVHSPSGCGNRKHRGKLHWKQNPELFTSYDELAEKDKLIWLTATAIKILLEKDGERQWKNGRVWAQRKSLDGFSRTEATD